MSIATDAPHGVDQFNSQHLHHIVRVIETSFEVRRRYQFFLWTQAHMQALLPHKLAVCGAYHRLRKDMVYESFHSIQVPEELLTAFADARSSLMQQVVGAWIDQRDQVLLLDVAQLGGMAVLPARDALLEAGYSELLVHGVARPQRPSELESLFVLGAPSVPCTPQQMMLFSLLMPHLHSTWMRVQVTEREMAGGQSSSTQMPRVPAVHSPITGREKQILSWVREGMSNQEIGEQLGISSLTVKNHVQKILRKLGAANRAQAVAKAMTQNLLDRSAPVSVLPSALDIERCA